MVPPLILTLPLPLDEKRLPVINIPRAEILPPLEAGKEAILKSIWPTIDADGCTWQVRVISDPDGDAASDIIEFTPDDRTRPVRRLAIARREDEDLGESELRNAFRQARPIGGDYYGRPGKRMPDAS